MLTLPVGCQVLRMGYYAALVPNTAIAKAAGASLWQRGATYLGDYAGRYLLVLPLVALLAAWAPVLVSRVRHRDPAGAGLVAAPVVGGLLHATYVVRLGGDFMHGRLLLPATFALLLPVLVVGVPVRSGRSAGRRVGRRVGGRVGGWAGRPGWPSFRSRRCRCWSSSRGRRTWR